MRILLLFIVLLMVLLSFYNFITLYRPKKSSQASDHVAVLVPMRNERENVGALITDLKNQVGVSGAHFYLLDDGSTDGTYGEAQLQIDNDPRFTLIEGKPLPPNWLGKPWALSQLEEVSNEEIIVTIDADVRVENFALASALTLLAFSRLDFISPYPRQIAESFIEKLIQPLIHWTWIATVPLRYASRAHRPSMAVANGQFFIVKRSALKEIGGFGAVKGEVLDDVMLARTLIRSGFEGTATEGASIASTRMYSSFQEICNGYGKSLWKAFGGKFGPYLAIAFIYFTSIYPFFLLTNGEFFGLLLSFYILITRIVSAVIAREKLRYTFFHPLSALIFIYIILYSVINHQRIMWKGRTL